MWKVFLSSTSKDLFEYREAVTREIHRLDGYHCVRMEDFGARDWQAAGFCQAKVQESHLFIGILGHLYGSSPEEDDRSYTEREYEVAVKLNLPRLMFVAPDSFAMPMDLREPEDRWQCQQAFRQRVNQERIRETFNSPQELALKVVQAIRNWEREQEVLRRGDTAPKARRRQQTRAARERGANLGELVPRLCDRTSQEGSFHIFFSEQVKRHPGRPQIYLIHGAEIEGHASLVERLRWTHIRDYAHHKWGDRRGVMAEKRLTDWPYEGEPADRQRLLLAKLFKAFDNDYEFESDDFSATAFARMSKKRLDPVIILSHEIRTARWNHATGELLKWYLQFWDEVCLHKPQPQFIIFLLVLYPQKENSGFLRSLLKLSRFDKKNIERELNEIFLPRQETLKQDRLGCPSLMLKELTCIARDDVMNWFSHNGIYEDEKTQREKCDGLIKEGDCRHMADIEYQLKLIHQEFMQKRGLV